MTFSKFGGYGVLSGFLFVLVAVTSVIGSQTGGNSRYGEVDIVTCRNCHQEKGKSMLLPSEKSKDEWEKYFANNYQLLKSLDHDFKEAGITDRQLEHIRAYLVENASLVPGKIDNTKSQKAPATKSETNQAVKEVAQTEEKAAGEEAFDPDTGDFTKGRYVLQKCQNCHKKHSNSPKLNPGDNIKDQWSRYFVNDYRKLKKAMPDFDTYGFTTSQLQNLHQFLRKYALDSDKPMTCN